MKVKQTIFVLSVLLLAALACNALQPATQPPQAPPPTVTPFAPQQGDTPAAPPSEGETPAAPPSEGETPAAPPESPTDTPAPPTSSPATATSTITPTVESAGPLSFQEVAPWDASCGQQLSDGRHEVVILLHIEGGAPPFTVKHIDDVFVTSEREYAVVFAVGGCGAIVHEIVVESADGQSFSDDYYLQDPCCTTPSP